ncbi:nuclear pore complex protein Nup93-1 [Scaptodrosophila lebanonensis]|uniref:Nuclear pore protein n=1 Tax=Drosophila lebanonensis TaxID=7225 RepID=A0A6J2TUP7_DROLE|nr:nuclear pore complex protein Nup93-1 [Scaptodrosophila lebanonensis]
MDYADLLIRAQRLANTTRTATDMPRVECSTLSQFVQATEEMHTRLTQSGTNDLQAYKFMGSKGVDLPKLKQKLEQLTARNVFESLDPIYDIDVCNYLKNERENAMLTVMEESKRSVFEAVEKQKWRNIYREWGEEKQRLLHTLVGPDQQDFPDMHRHTVPTVLHEDAKPYSRLNKIESLYAKEITIYNEMIIQGGSRPNLVATFTDLSQQFLENEQVHEMWSVLRYMADVTPLSRNVDPIASRQKTPVFVRQARTYLEQRYKIYMSTIIEKNLLVAQRGGIPNIYHMVSSFVSVTFQHPQTLVGLLDVANGKPLWPLVYFSLRSGDWQAAIQYLKEFSYCPDLIKIMAQKQRPEEEMTSGKIEGQLKLEYAKKLRMSTDPYKKAVYAIVLACDPHEPHSEVVRTIDDFLWLQLSVLRTDDRREYNIEQLTYGGLQTLILEKYGESYFNAREKAPLYFQVLALTGQFESAIEFLARTDANRPHAVHMAIALNELCMLGAPSSVQTPLLSTDPNDPHPMRRLNLARLIIMYAKAFEQTDTAEALQYYYLLRHFKAADGRNLMMVCVCDLLVDNCNERMLQLIFGEPQVPGSWRYSGGIFVQFHTMDYDMYSLAGMVGDELTNRGSFELAIQLYFIAGQFDKAMRVASSMLSQVVHQAPKKGGMRERLAGITERLNAILTTKKTELEAHIVVTYSLLSELLTFFDYYHEGEHRLATEILYKNKLTPSNYSEVDDCVIRLKRVGTEVIKVLPDVFLAAMNIIYTEYLSQRGNETGSPKTTNNSKESMLQHLRVRAKALTNMAASLPYRIPAETNKRLVQMEILMH